MRPDSISQFFSAPSEKGVVKQENKMPKEASFSHDASQEAAQCPPP